nr:glutamine synthetase cytosolic isozyme-like [Ipomoea batatas]GMC94756.1 glutamine synthetase cytosolic isozyme-like [Ipomoea batatas]
MPTLQLESLSQPTRDIMLPRFLATLRLPRKSHGMELSKNTLSCKRMLSGLLDGLLEVILDHRDRTIVALELTKLSGVTLWTHTTRPAFTRGLTSVELTEK